MLWENSLEVKEVKLEHLLELKLSDSQLEEKLDVMLEVKSKGQYLEVW